MNTLYEYKELTLDERAAYLWEHGTFLMNDEVDDKRVNLYALSNFYVEVVYDNPANEIVRLRAFKSIIQFDKHSA